MSDLLTWAGRARWARFRSAHLLCWVCVMALIARAVPGQEQDPIEAWREVASKVESLRVDWEQAQAGGPMATAGDGKPHSTGVITVRILGDCLRYDFDGDILGEEGVSKSQSTVVLCASDPVSPAFEPGVGRHVNFPTGWLYKQSKSRLIRGRTTKPLVWAYRPFVPELGGYDLSTARVLRENSTLNGAPCAEVKLGPLKVWLSSQYHLPLRVVAHNGGRPIWQIDMKYQELDGYFVPQEWISASLKSSTREVARVTAVAVNDGSITDADFEIEFPPNTLVVDMTQDKVRDYILRADGTERVITHDERHAGYEQWVATESGQATAPLPERPLGPVAIVIGVIMCGLVVYGVSVLIKWRK